MPKHVIQLVEDMISRQKQPLMTGGVPHFEWRPRVPVEDEKEPGPQDEISVQLEERQLDDNNNVQEEQLQEKIIEDYIEEPIDIVPEVLYNSDEGLHSNEKQSYPYDEEENQHRINEDSSKKGDQNMLDPVLEDDVHDNNETIEDNEQLEIRSANESTGSSENIVEEEHEEMQEDFDAEVCGTSRGEFSGQGYNFRPRAKVEYTNIYDHIVDDEINDQNHDMQLLQDDAIEMNEGRPTRLVFKHLTSIILTQMSVKAGIKKHGKSSIDALYDDFFPVGR